MLCVKGKFANDFWWLNIIDFITILAWLLPWSKGHRNTYALSIPPKKHPGLYDMKEKKKIQLVINKARNFDEFPKHDMYANEYLWINREEKKHALTTQNKEKNRQNTELHTMQLRPHDFSVKPKSAYKKPFVDVCACGEGGIFPKNFFLYNLFDFFLSCTKPIWPFSVLLQRRRNNFLKTK